MAVLAVVRLRDPEVLLLLQQVHDAPREQGVELLAPLRGARGICGEELRGARQFYPACEVRMASDMILSLCTRLPG